jgi:hypothetical protein
MKLDPSEITIDKIAVAGESDRTGLYLFTRKR